MTSTTQVLIALSSIVVAYFVKTALAKRKLNPRGLPYPPGPKGLPVIGNLTQLPQHKPWLVYKEWGRTYGDLMYLEAMGQPMIIINSLSRALDLLDKRAVNYSDRPHVPTMDLMKLDWVFAFMQYGADWRNHRRAFHQYLNHNMVHNYHPIQEQETQEFLRALIARPKDFLAHTRHLFGSIIIRISYGFEDEEYNKVLVEEAEALASGFSESIIPGRYLVNAFPFLRHVPAWLPGAGFQRTMQYLRKISEKTLSEPFDNVKEALKTGNRQVGPSLAVGLIESLPDETHANRTSLEVVARNTSALSYIAGADTTVSSAQALILALAMHPEVQRKAQKEIDSVVGTDRLPNMSDKPNMPYVQAIVKEAGRWHTVLPLGFIHVSAKEDEYDGYFIPKGSFIFVNTWAIMHDPDVFKNPLQFNPERYLKNGQIDTSVLDPEAATFGFGRRICPGRWLSNDSLFLMAASLLATFNIAAPKDRTGKPIPLSLDTSSHLITAPLPYDCEFQLRSPKYAALLQK
ncbi:cytochrome P450 [Coprinopsis cinerea AmutBmut pab1-1]|nr:cytochrome P450 [Coprinopsis cinerea AmutBmut pab1-1]